MNCRKIKRNLEEYLDGALSVKQKSGFERHVRNCADCEQYVRERRRWGDVLTGSMEKMAGGLETPPGLLKSVVRNARDTGRRPVFPLIRRSKLAAAAILPAAALVLLLVFVPHGDGRKPLPGVDGRGTASYLKLTTTHYEGRSRDPWTVKRVYVAHSNGDDGFLSLELIRDSKYQKEE